MESRIRIGLYSACVVVLRFRTGLKDRTWVPPPLPLSSAPSPLTHSLTQGVYVTLVSCISACGVYVTRVTYIAGCVRYSCFMHFSMLLPSTRVPIQHTQYRYYTYSSVSLCSAIPMANPTRSPPSAVLTGLSCLQVQQQAPLPHPLGG